MCGWNWCWLFFLAVFYICPHAILIAATIPFFPRHPFIACATIFSLAACGAAKTVVRVKNTWGCVHGRGAYKPFLEGFFRVQRIGGRSKLANVLVAISIDLLSTILLDNAIHLLFLQLHMLLWYLLPSFINDIHIVFVLTVHALASTAVLIYRLDCIRVRNIGAPIDLLIPAPVISMNQCFYSALVDLVRLLQARWNGTEWKSWTTLAQLPPLPLPPPPPPPHPLQQFFHIGGGQVPGIPILDIQFGPGGVLHPQRGLEHVMFADLFAQLAARGPPVGAGMKPPVKVDAAWPKDIDIPKEVANDDTVPRELCCPISLCLMRNPTMVGTSGYT